MESFVDTRWLHEEEEVEEGEIEGADAEYRVGGYSKEHEWPAASSSSHVWPAQPHRQVSPVPQTPRASPPAFAGPLCRLVVISSNILPPRARGRVAVLDGHDQVSIGRDVLPGGIRLRLKEMAVSKFHANIFWDGERKEWAIVDMGSKHGTFISRTNASAGALEQRLSLPSTSSIPRALQHLDKITIGSTSLLVHIHIDSLPCLECTTSTNGEIPIFSNSEKSKQGKTASSKDLSSLGSLTTHASLPANPKQALAKLKSTLLAAHIPPRSDAKRAAPDEPTYAYTDRSAKRRALHRDTDTLLSRPRPRSPTPPSALKTQEPPAPIPSTNIGHALLLKQGWSPGSGLGRLPNSPSGRALHEPLTLTASVGRSGLGRRPVADPQDGSGDWRKDGRQRLWNEYPSKR